MKSQMQVEQSQEQQQSGTSQANGFGSNSAQGATLSSNSSTLGSVFGLIVAGQIQESKKQIAQLADRARQHQDNQTVQWAGNIWTVAHAFSEIQHAISQEALDGVQEKAALIGTLTRGLIGSGHISQESGDRVLQSAGGYWTMANKAKEEKSQTANGETPSTDKNTAAAGALSTAQNSETVEQYKLPTNKTWAHCGIATSMMLLQANGKGDMADANQLVSEMYISGKGSDVGLMAEAMRKRGLKTAEGTRNGTWGPLMDTLKSGQPVPFGITHSVGDVVKMNKASSKHYANYKPGDRHYRKFGESGHWVLVVGFEGSPEKPTHFLFNDPDVGGQIRATKSELEQMGVGNGQFFQITQ